MRSSFVCADPTHGDFLEHLNIFVVVLLIVTLEVNFDHVILVIVIVSVCIGDAFLNVLIIFVEVYAGTAMGPA